MKAHESNFGFMKQETSIENPFFQRAYVWEQLLADLQESFECKKSHFLGSIVLKQLDTNTGKGTKRGLIDGQQRLTTFSILVKALYDRLDSKTKLNNATYLFEDIVDKIPKITHSKIDKETFEAILKAENFEDLESKFKVKIRRGKDEVIKDKLIGCYEFFTNKFDKIDETSKREWNIEEIRNFFQHILTSNLWVLIDLEKDEDEQKIFDSIDTAGLKFTATDIIKNAIFDKACET